MWGNKLCTLLCGIIGSEQWDDSNMRNVYTVSALKQIAAVVKNLDYVKTEIKFMILWYTGVLL